MNWNQIGLFCHREQTNEQDTSHDARAQNDVAIFSNLAILENSNALIASRSHSSAAKS